MATLAVLGITCKIYLEWSIHGNKGNGGEIQAEIMELKTNIKFADFLESSNSLFTYQIEKRILCESAGIKVELMNALSDSMLGGNRAMHL